MESVEERIYLAPHTMETQLGHACEDLVFAVIESVKVVDKHASPVPLGEVKTTATSVKDSGKLATGAEDEKKQIGTKSAADPKVEKAPVVKAEAPKGIASRDTPIGLTSCGLLLLGADLHSDQHSAVDVVRRSAGWVRQQHLVFEDDTRGTEET